MNELKKRIVRLVRILGTPYGEIVGVFWINDEVIVDSISLTEDGRDFEMSIFSSVCDEDDYEAIIPSDYLTMEELESMVIMLEEYLVRS